MTSALGDKRIGALFDTLSTLSVEMLGSHEASGLQTVFEAVLAATGCGRGAAYTTAGGALSLVAERGLPASLRPQLERLSLASAPQFIAQQAALTKGLVVDRAAASFGTDLAKALVIAGWSSAVACPIAANGHVFGVIVLAAPAEVLGAPALATLQVACNLVALQMLRQSLEQRLEEHRSGDARSMRLLVRGMLAGGVAGEIDPALAALERAIVEQRKRIEDARVRAPSDDDIDELARLASGSATAVGQLRQSADRFLATMAPGRPELIDLGRATTDALALMAPLLRTHKIEIRARCPEGHLVVGGRGEMMELVTHVLLNVAGVLDDPRALAGGASTRPRKLELDVERYGDHVVLRINDAWEGTDSARARLLASPGGNERALSFAVARQIVIARRGHIELGPDGAGGVRCDVVLPAATREKPRALPAAKAPAARQNARPLILWIDDELSARIVSQSLEDCEVHVAGTAAEATQLLFRLGTKPAAIFCSLRLPDRPGHELHADIAGFSPELAKRFVFLADGLLASDVASYLVESGCPTLMRPIELPWVRDLAFADQDAAIRCAPTLTPPTRPMDLELAASKTVVPEPAVTRTATGRIVPGPPPQEPARTATGRIVPGPPPPQEPAVSPATSKITSPEPAVTRTATGRIVPVPPAPPSRPAASRPGAPPQRPRFARMRLDPGHAAPPSGPDAPAEHSDPRTAPTDPMLPAAQLPTADAPASHDGDRTQTLKSSGPGLPPSTRNPEPPPPRGRLPSGTNEAETDAAPAMREAQLHNLAAATAEALRQSGPTRGPAVLEMLRGRGLSEAEALSVVMHGLATGTLVRDPPWSILLKAAPLKPHKSVLVVDDDDDVRESLRQVLEEDGYTVETAADGRQALEKLRASNDPNQIVLLDLNMPVMDGWTFLREARADPALARIPVLVLSARYAKSGGEEFLPKPVNYYALLATVERLSKQNATPPS